MKRLVITLALVLLAVLPPALPGGAPATAAWQAADTNSGRQVIRIGRPTPTPQPPPPPPAGQTQGVVVRQGAPAGQRQGAGGIEPTMPRFLGSLPPGLPDLRKLRQKVDASELLPIEKRKPVTTSAPFTAEELMKRCATGTTCAHRLIQVGGETKVLSKGQRVPINEYV